MTRNGSVPDIDTEVDELPGEEHLLKTIIAKTRTEVLTVDRRLSVIESRVTDLTVTIESGVKAIKILGAVVTVIGLAGPALSWALQHISFK